MDARPFLTMVVRGTKANRACNRWNYLDRSAYAPLPSWVANQSCTVVNERKGGSSRFA